MNKKIFILLFLFIALISMSAVSAVDLDDGNETVALSDIGVEKLSVSNDVNAIDDLNKDDAGSEAVLENAVKSSDAGEKEILGVGDSDSDVLGVKGSKIAIAEASSEKVDSSHYIIRVAGFVTGVDYEDIDKGTVSIYLNDESKETCTAYSGIFQGEVRDVGPGTYYVRVSYHDDSGDYSDSQNEYYDNPIIIEPPEPTTWYVNGSKPYGNGGKSEEDAFSTLNEALIEANNNDTVKIAAGTYTGIANIGGYIQKILTFEKYGDGEVIFDGQGQGKIWSVGVDTINIYGLTFINGHDSNGGALYFSRDLSNSVINATFINNTVNNYGGAIYVDNSVSNLTLRSTFINNTANEYGAAVYIKSAASNLILNSSFIGNTADNCGAGVYIGDYADNVNVYGEFRDNVAQVGGAICANNAFSSSVIDATFINNTATIIGGAFFFNGALTGVDISGKFINNTGGDSIIYVANSVSGNSIHDSVFLNNDADKIISVIYGEITAKDNWFGNNASNYYEMPEDVGIDLENWLFLNATADPSELDVGNSSQITFKLSSFGGSEIIDYDASKMNITLDLSQTLGELDKTSALIGEKITYTAKDGGNATVTGKFETASYTVSLTNKDSKIPTSINITNSTVDLKVNEEIASGATLTPADAGNLTYTSTNSSVAVVENDRIKALAAGNATITVSFAGNDTYAAAENKTIVVTVTLNDASVSVNNSTLDLLVDDEFVLVVTTAPEGLNVTFTPDNSGVVSVDENGVVTAIKEGNATVKVSVGGDGVYALNTTDVAVTVKKIPTEIIVGDDVDMKVGESAVVNATLSPADAGELDYTSSDVSVVSVNGIGELTAVGDGSAVITVRFLGDDKYAAAESKNVTVTVSLNDASVSAKDMELNVGDNATVDAITSPEGLNVTYVADNSGVVSVEDGVVTAVKEGTAKITLTVGGDGVYAENSTTITVTVTKIDTSISVDVDSVDMNVGDNAKIDATLSPADAGELDFTSSDVSVVSVNGIGELTAVADGTAVITISFAGDDKYAAAKSKNVTVTVSLKDASVSAKDMELNVGDNNTIVPVTTPEGLNVTYVADNSGVVSVEDGVVTAVKEGTAKITLTVGGDGVYAENSTTITVTVKKIDTSIDVDSNSLDLEIGDNSSIVATLTPADAGNVTFTSSNSSVVTVDAKGNVKAVGAGEANITVSFAGDDKYAAAENKTVEVTVAEYMVVSAPDLTKYYNGPERFVVEVTDSKGNPLANQSVNITINGVTYSRTTNDNGTASISISLVSGQYNVTTAVGNNTVYSTITVLSTVNATDLVKVFRNGTQFYATFKDSRGNYLPDGTMVRFNINGVMYDRKISGDNGLAKLNINLESGHYIITSMNPITGENASNNVTVISRLIENSDITKYYRNATQYTVKVIGDDGKAVGAGETVTFNINGVFYSRTTNESGIAKLNINLQPGDYVITAEYKNCRVSNNIKVLPVLSAGDLTKKYGTSDQFVATLIDGQGKPYAEQRVQFNINGVLYNRVTDSSGQAKLNINLQPGQYIITSSYDGLNIANTITISA